MKDLGDIATFTGGRSYRSRDLHNSDTALVTLKSFRRGGGYRYDGLKPYIGRFRDEQVIEPGDVVLACTDVTQAAEVIGKPAIVQPSPHYTKLVASLDAMIMRPSSGRVNREFLYLLCSTERFADYTYAHTSGTTVLHLSKKAIPSFRAVVPSHDVMAVFDKVSIPVFAKMQTISREQDALAGLRDALLPGLVSGVVVV
ncbi:MAG: hypothetical protein F4X57_09375 [Chloroflexi bacterium]|nr:hypothetical protein [Chloroflexota bacterium]